MFGPNDDIAKKAKSHSGLAFSVVTRRTNSGKSVRGLTTHHHVHCADYTTCGTVCSLQSPHGHMRIRIQRSPPFIGGGGTDRINMCLWMSPQQIIFSGKRRFDAQQIQPFKGTKHGIKPRNLLWVARRGHVIKAIFMCNQSCCHAPKQPVSGRRHKLLLFKITFARGIKACAPRLFGRQHITSPANSLQITRLLWVHLDLATQACDLHVNGAFLRLPARAA